MSSEELTLHSKLTRRLVVDCVVETGEPLHIGIGKEQAGVSEVDMPTMVNRNGTPVIPGSSIRGALRAHVTRLLSSLDSSTLSDAFSVERVKASENELLENFVREKTSHGKIETFAKKFGAIEKLFGTSGYASPLRITDATLRHDVDLIERMHVKISTELDRAEVGPFDIQAVPEASQFSFKIIFDELSDPTLEDANKVFYKLLLKLIAIGNGLEIFLGGMRSRGYGLCLIKADQISSYSPKTLALGETPQPRRDVAQFINEIVRE